jgi:uncharacterized protein (UPF0332 family)
LTPEQDAFVNKAEESLQAAQLLAGQGFYNFAVSRAYYTMFYIASAFLLSKGLSFSSHAGVISAFGQQFARTGLVPSEFHRYLIEGQDNRNIGDYDVIGPGITETQALEQLTRAAQFIELARQIIDSLSSN